MRMRGYSLRRLRTSCGQVFANEVPYKIDLLAIKFKKTVKQIEYAYNLFSKLGMLTFDNDIFSVSNWAKYQSIDKLEKIKENNRKRVALFRQKQKEILLEGKCNVTSNVTSNEKCNENALISNSLSNIYLYWNEKDIIKHKELTENISNDIEKALTVYSEDEIKTYIDRYTQVIKDDNYFFDYKWTLADFLNRKDGISSFTDEGSKWVSYLSFCGNKPKTKKANFRERTYSKDDMNRIFSDIHDIDNINF